MRRLIVSLVVPGVLVLGGLTWIGGNRAAAQAPGKRKQAKPVAPAGYGNADSITEDELKIHTYVLASDQMEGRNFPSRGYDAAALYVASQLAQWGLKPGGSTSGTNGPLQPYF